MPAVEAEPVPVILESQTGLASYYSDAFQGDRTASGEIFDQNELVAAHHSYPIGTIVRVTNLENAHEVKVRVNDRGPTAENRDEGVIIDLSRSAARKLDFIEDGRTKVRADVLEWGESDRDGFAATE